MTLLSLIITSLSLPNRIIKSNLFANTKYERKKDEKPEVNQNEKKKNYYKLQC